LKGWSAVNWARVHRAGGTFILEVIVFTSGGVLLALEIVASRVLAPFFGNSIYVWGSLIGVFLAALSVGYAVGGRTADRYPSFSLFAGIVFGAGLLTLPIPLFAGPVLGAIARTDLGPQLSPLAAAAALFFLPSVVLGMVSPFAVRLRARAVTMVGRTAGSLYTISTVGSIVGTFAASFVLLNLIGVREIIFLLGLTLMIVAVLGWVTVGHLSTAELGAAAVILASAGATWAAPSPDASVVYTDDTVYHRIVVSDEGPTRYLRLDNVWQSALDLDNPRRTPEHFAYLGHMHLPLVFNAEPKRVTLLGLGGGTLVNRYLADYPTMTMDVAEIDPEVVDVARRFFGVKEDHRVRINAQDARLHLDRIPEPRDIILTDAYLKDRIPFHLATREFFTLVRARLAPGGVLASNIIGAVDGPNSRLFRAIYRTIGEVFATVYVFPVDFARDGMPERIRNVIVIATDEPPLPRDEVARRARALVEVGTVTVDRFPDAASDLYTQRIPIDDVPVLSDDFAPVDALIPR
jgi:spermidine synthase